MIWTISNGEEKEADNHGDIWEFNTTSQREVMARSEQLPVFVKLSVSGPLVLFVQNIYSLYYN